MWLYLAVRTERDARYGQKPILSIWQTNYRALSDCMSSFWSACLVEPVHGASAFMQQSDNPSAP